MEKKTSQFHFRIKPTFRKRIGELSELRGHKITRIIEDLLEEELKKEGL